MSSLQERIRNVVTDQLDTERQQAYEQGMRDAARQVRDQLLAEVPGIRQSWTQGLIDGAHEAGTPERAQIDLINRQLNGLREIDPSIEAKVDFEQIRTVAYEAYERLEARRDLERQESPGLTALAAAHEQLNQVVLGAALGIPNAMVLVPERRLESQDRGLATGL